MKTYFARIPGGLGTGLFAVAVALCLSLSAPAFAGNEEPVLEVPGGMAAVSRLWFLSMAGVVTEDTGRIRGMNSPRHIKL